MTPSEGILKLSVDCLQFSTVGFRNVQKMRFYWTLILNWRSEENLVANNKDNRVFMSRNYRSYRKGGPLCTF